MERGFEQLIVIAAIILAGAFDLLARWHKSRQQKHRPVDASGYDENPVLLEDNADFELPFDVELPSDIELSGEELVERPVPPLLSPPRLPVVSRRPAPPPPPLGRPRRASPRLLTNPLDARRGIIMMTILGPCRGLERPDSAP